MTSTPKKTARRQTRLGYRLRELAKKPEYADQAAGLLVAANTLDTTCWSLGLRGDAVKSCGAYRAAVDKYYLVTGSRYNG